MIQITVTLDETIITDAARRAVAAAYAGPSYNSAHGAPGYEAIRAQVLEFVRSLDLRAEIATAAPPIVQAIVVDVLAAELRKRIKAEVKALADTSALFEVQS